MAKVITLTDEQALTLSTYIDGAIKYPDMLDNAEWWRITHRELAGIKAQVDNAPDLENAKKHRHGADR